MERDSADFGSDALRALANELRPELHRYCARLTGSMFDGEDVVQDVFERAFASADRLDQVSRLRPWLFRIAHNRAIDLIRSRKARKAEPIGLGIWENEPDDASSPDEKLVQMETVQSAVSRFLELPISQRSVVILKDVLDHSLTDISTMLGLSVNSVKAHLARGRAKLKAINCEEPRHPKRPFSAATLRYAELFNAGDWEGLRVLLAADARLQQSDHTIRVGAKDVGLFFTVYSQLHGTRLKPAWVDGREVLAVFLDEHSDRPDYAMMAEWHGEQISFIRDYRYVRYVFDDSTLDLG